MNTHVILAFLLIACFPGGVLAQRQFDSAQDAAETLISATAKNDTAQIAAIFGPQGRSTLSSGNASQDQAERAEFARIAREKHEVKFDSRNPSRAILFVGAEDWPFPAPIVRTAGKWMFDAAGGDLELQARRVGADELDAIEVCAGYVEAQNSYAEQSREKGGMPVYARRIMSSPGQHDGLYWDGGSLTPRGFAEAAWDSGGNATAKTKPYHGYYFRILHSQGPNAPGGQHEYLVKNALIGGFGLVAWPAEYGVTGVHTFVVNHDGVIFEKDLGPPGNAVTPVTRYDPDQTWNPVE